MQQRRENISQGDIIIQYVIIAIVCFFGFFINNSILPADIMEARNLATAQEMVNTDNYLIPTMNGELRLEKPPLPTWIAAGIEHITPGNLIVQRCAAGLMGTLMVFFLYFLVSRLTRNKNIGFIASLVLATTYTVVAMSRMATWDIYCHSFMLGGIYFFLLAIDDEGRQWKNFIAAGLFFGLSFLSKGPVSFYALLLPFLLCYFLIYRPSMRKKFLPLLLMIVITLVLSLWWTVYIYMFHPEVFSQVIEKESGSWLNHNVRPWYYYWKFPAEAGPWAFFLITAMIYFFVTKRRENRREYKFFLSWLILTLILLSLIPEKKTRYLLPMLISGAGVITFYIYRCFKGLHRRWEMLIFRINVLVIVLIVAAIPFGMYFLFYKEGIISLLTLILSAVFSWGLCFYILKSLFHKGRIQVLGAFGGIISCMIMIEAFCLIPIGRTFTNVAERHSIRMLRDNKAVAGLPFFYNEKEDLRIELVYESNRIIRPINPSDSTLVVQNMPFVFVSGQPIDSIFKGINVEVDHIDTFDNNWRKQDSSRYNINLVREVAIIKPKY